MNKIGTNIMKDFDTKMTLHWWKKLKDTIFMIQKNSYYENIYTIKSDLQWPTYQVSNDIFYKNKNILNVYVSVSDSK